MIEETEYMKKDWAYNVLNCNIDEERSVMISDDKFRSESAALKAGVILGSFNITVYQFSRCGRWSWLAFDNKEDAMAFKLRWE